MTGTGLTSWNDEPRGPGATPTRRALPQADTDRKLRAVRSLCVMKMC